MRHLALVIAFQITSFVYSQTDNYFYQKREYHFKAVYIDSNGDTITCEKIIIKPTGKKWFVQPSLQNAIEYYFQTDTAGYKNWVHPIPYYHERNMKYYKKKGKYRIKTKSVTGGYEDDTVFYMHPPRTNQYRMLFYAPHFYVRYKYLSDTIACYTSGMTIYGMGRFHHHNAVLPLRDTLISGEKVKAWNLVVTSTGDIEEKFKVRKVYNSKMDAIFTHEFGFIKVHYTFENGIKIQFDLEEVVEL